MEIASTSASLRLDVVSGGGRLLREARKGGRAEVVCGLGNLWSLDSGRNGRVRSLMTDGGFSSERPQIWCASVQENRLKGRGGSEDWGQSLSRPKVMSTKLQAYAADDLNHQPEKDEPAGDVEDVGEEAVHARQVEDLLVGRSESRPNSIVGVNSPHLRRKTLGKRARIPGEWSFQNLAEEWASFTGPRENGDVRDVVLMSLSFAVLVYISQHLVHAYCTLRHLYKL